MGQERYLMAVDLERRPYTPPSQEGLRCWRSPSRGVVVKSFNSSPPSKGVFAPNDDVDDWEEIEPPHSWDHEHCEFCGVAIEEAAKVAARPASDRLVVTEGYLVVESGVETQKWICVKCFEDFRDEFQWSVTNTNEKSSD
jgi:hypothetical protein